MSGWYMHHVENRRGFMEENSGEFSEACAALFLVTGAGQYIFWEKFL